MLHWLAKKQLTKIRIFKFRVFVLSFCFHLIILTFLLFINYNDPLKIEINSKFRDKTVPIIFLPLSKNVSNNLKNINKNNQPKIVQKQQINKVVQLKNETKVSIQKTVQNKMKVNNEVKIKQIVSKKEENKIVNKNEKLNKKVLEKEIIKKTEVAEPILKEKQINKEQNEKPVKEMKENLKIKESQEKNLVNEEINTENSLLIGRKDLEINEIAELINFEIKKSWSPPPGLSKNLKCIFTFFINFEGKAENIKVKEKSKSIVYDMSAKISIEKTVFPKEIHNREIIQQFGPEE